MGNGSILIEKVGAKLTAACKKTGALSIEVTLTPAANRQGRAGRKVSPARIITLCPKGKPDRAAFTLAQAGNTLVFQLRTSGADDKTPAPAWTDLKCKLSAGKATHVVVTYGGDGLAVYVDGRMTFPAPLAVGDFGDWSEGQLLLGGIDANREAWSGNLGGVAIFDRVLGAAEVLSDHRRYRAIGAARKAIDKFKVKAKFPARPDIPTPKDVLPYPSALVFCKYQTTPLPGDNQPPPTRFLVAEWAVLAHKAVPLDRKKGQTYTLILERFEDNPQLDSVPPFWDQNEKDSNVPPYFSVPLYFETGR